MSERDETAEQAASTAASAAAAAAAAATNQPLAGPARVRTHLANERTFLAWMRTGLTCIALGLAAAQLLDEQRVLGVPLTKVLSGSLVVLGVWLVVLGRWRFRQAAIGILNDTFRIRRRGFESVVVGAVLIGALALLVIARMRI